MSIADDEVTRSIGPPDVAVAPRLKLEVASDYNRFATAQADVGDRPAALANHDKAVAMSRERYAANPSNVELKVFEALEKAGTIGGTDRDTLAAARKELARIRDQLKQVR